MFWKYTRGLPREVFEGNKIQKRDMKKEVVVKLEATFEARGIDVYTAHIKPLKHKENNLKRESFHISVIVLLKPSNK